MAAAVGAQAEALVQGAAATAAVAAAVVVEEEEVVDAMAGKTQSFP